MKILFLDTLYRPILEELNYYSSPKPEEKYDQLIETLSKENFASGSSLSQKLSKLGHDCHIVYVNAKKSQEAWRREKGPQRITGSFFWKNWQIISMIPICGMFIHNKSPLTRIVLEQAKAIKPDFIYCLNINFLTKGLISKLKATGAIIVGQHASPLPLKSIFTSYDHIFSAHPGQVSKFREEGVSSSHIALAFDEGHNEDQSTEGWPERTRDASFVGTFGRHQKKTAQLMKAISENGVNLDIFTLTSKRKMKRLGLEKHYRGKAWGNQMYKILAESKIVINRHGEVADGLSVNFRMFEATGMGALLVTENSTNIRDLFEPGLEVVTYNGVDDAASKIKEILDNFSQYDPIAKAGQKRTLASHTFSNRAEQIESKLGELLIMRQSSYHETIKP